MVKNRVRIEIPAPTSNQPIALTLDHKGIRQLQLASTRFEAVIIAAEMNKAAAGPDKPEEDTRTLLGLD